ncbi:MAG: hypothetical protein GF368_02895 [Candidatus Aenigmarchaeota archaeon]|nr:hypothetical protein [Candidatus Aenigmarchaeota archaeon]
MKHQLKEEIIQEWVDHLDSDEWVIKLFEKVRDIPYGDINSRDPKDVYEKRKGTCSGKHELLKELYDELGIETKDFIALHKFNDLNVVFPKEIKRILDEYEIFDYHNFFKILVNGDWITVDVTWDRPLKKLGFFVNENWDGKSNMELCVVPIEIFEVEDSVLSKKQKLMDLPKETQKYRKIFLEELTVWLDEFRSK